MQFFGKASDVSRRLLPTSWLWILPIATVVVILVSFYLNFPLAYRFSCSPFGGWQAFYVAIGIMAVIYVRVHHGLSFARLFVYLSPLALLLPVLLLSRHFQCEREATLGVLNSDILHYYISETLRGLSFVQYNFFPDLPVYQHGIPMAYEAAFVVYRIVLNGLEWYLIFEAVRMLRNWRTGRAAGPSGPGGIG